MPILISYWNNCIICGRIKNKTYLSWLFLLRYADLKLADFKWIHIDSEEYINVTIQQLYITLVYAEKNRSSVQKKIDNQ